MTPPLRSPSSSVRNSAVSYERAATTGNTVRFPCRIGSSTLYSCETELISPASAFSRCAATVSPITAASAMVTRKAFGFMRSSQGEGTLHHQDARLLLRAGRLHPLLVEERQKRASLHRKKWVSIRRNDFDGPRHRARRRPPARTAKSRGGTPLKISRCAVRHFSGWPERHSGGGDPTLCGRGHARRGAYLLREPARRRVGAGPGLCSGQRTCVAGLHGAVPREALRHRLADRTR